MEHTIKVTRIGDGWNIRAYFGDRVVDEYRCYCREDIGWCARQLLRNCDKYYTGGDLFTSSVRKRMWDVEKYSQQPVGVVKNVHQQNNKSST